MHGRTSARTARQLRDFTGLARAEPQCSTNSVARYFFVKRLKASVAIASYSSAGVEESVTELKSGARQIENAKTYLTFNMGGSLTTSVVMAWGRE